MTTVLIVDGSNLQRLRIRMLLEAQPEMSVVGEASQGQDAVRLTAGSAPMSS